MSTPTLEILCDTNPMCYGSSTALLAILDALRSRMGDKVHVTSLVHGVTREVLRGDAAVDDTIEVDAKDPDCVRDHIEQLHFDAVLVVSNQSNVGVYCALGIPIFFVDILFWYGREKTGRVWRDAERTFVQNFPGVNERIKKVEPSPILTGPLLRPVMPSGSRSGTLVALGGGRSTWVVPGDNSFYATRVCDWVHAMPELPSPITIAGGLDAIASVDEHHPIRERARLVTLSNEAYLQLLASSDLVLTAPGLNAVFEALYSETPFAFLPPQNASQVAQLARYEAAGLVELGINLPQLDPLYPLDWQCSNERTQTEFVLASLRRLEGKERIQEVVRILRSQLADWDSRRHAARSFVEFLGSPGGDNVATTIHDWWRMLWM